MLRAARLLRFPAGDPLSVDTITKSYMKYSISISTGEEDRQAAPSALCIDNIVIRFLLCLFSINCNKVTKKIGFPHVRKCLVIPGTNLPTEIFSFYNFSIFLSG